MAKRRTAIPPDTAAEVMYVHDRTCCVCGERGLRVQLHHINEDPADHRRENLAVLCFEDHDKTQTKGGFGRHLGPQEIIRFRDEWLRRVRDIRDRSDAALALSGSARSANASGEADQWHPEDPALWGPYVAQMPELRKVLWATARGGWDSGVTLEMNGACWEVIAGLQGMWLRLMRCFPPHHLSPLPAAHYISEWTGERARWHRALYEPGGPGTGGTILGQIVGMAVIKDLSGVLADLVEALSYTHDLDGLDLRTWRREWNQAIRRPLVDEVAAWWDGVKFDLRWRFDAFTRRRTPEI